MDGENKESLTASDALPKGTGFDSARQSTIFAARSILTTHPNLTALERARLVRAFRSALVLRKKPGRKPKPQITAALENYRHGMRGLALYQAHIPGWSNMSRWRRQAASRTLMESIRSRFRRERMRH